MKRETIIGVVLLVLFVALVAVGGYVADRLVYMVGCFAIGWNIPDASAFINRKLFKGA